MPRSLGRRVLFSVLWDCRFEVASKVSEVWYSFILDGLQMFTQPAEDFFPLGIAELLPKFIEREVDDVVVMNLLRGNVAAKFKPNAVQEINLLRSEMRRMRPEIKNMFLAAREIEFRASTGVWDRVDAPRPSPRYELLQ